MSKCRSRSCLCRTCLNTCCDRRECLGKKETCERYGSFRQLSIFESPQKKQYQKAPRHSWNYYGITKERYKELTRAMRSGKHDVLMREAACAANKDIAKYLLLSVTEDKSYDALQIKWELKELERMPCCRTDFYGYRRLFYHLFDDALRKRGKNGQKAE